jgi:hypothetical protein
MDAVLSTDCTVSVQEQVLNIVFPNTMCSHGGGVTVQPGDLDSLLSLWVLRPSQMSQSKLRSLSEAFDRLPASATLAGV